MKLRFEVAKESHARLIVEHMRQVDIQEVRALSGLGPLAAMSVALSKSCYARVCFLEHIPLALFGLAHLSLLGESAQVWCFGTRFIRDYPLSFLKASRIGLAELYRRSRVLTSYVDVEDVPAQRWLAALGALYVLQPEEHGGRLFNQFVLAHRTPKAHQCQRG